MPVDNIFEDEDYNELWNNIGREDIIMLCYGGSYAYGTNTENSDIDVRGIFKNNKSELLGIVKDRESITLDNTDTVLYSLKKIIRLLYNCNPNVIELLGLRDSDYIYRHSTFDYIMNNSYAFLSKRAIYTFGEYAKSQLNRLINRSGRALSEVKSNENRSIEKALMSFEDRYRLYGKDSIKTRLSDDTIYLDINLKDYPIDEVSKILNELNTIHRNYKKSNRNDKATTKGKLSKHMMHLIRLYMMGIDIIKNERIITYRSGSEHDLLMSIRNGDYLDGIKPTDGFYEVFEDYKNRFDEASKSTKLPDNVDYNKINELLITMNEILL